jgi:predicted nucleic acid-binding protein
MTADIFFDTNILIYAHCMQAPHKMKIAREYLESGMRYGTGVISTQVLGELIVNVTKKVVPAMPLAQVVTEIELLAESPRIVEINTECIKNALALSKEHQLSCWDSLIIASAEKAKCQTLLSEDLTHGRKYGRVKVINPFTKK